MRVLSLCSGYGGLELALEKVLPDVKQEVVAVCDNYGPARQVLASHWPRACLLSTSAAPDELPP